MNNSTIQRLINYITIRILTNTTILAAIVQLVMKIVVKYPLHVRICNYKMELESRTLQFGNRYCDQKTQY